MASAKTKEFEVYSDLTVTTTAGNTVLDLSDYVDVADNEVFALDEWDVIINPTDTWPSVETEIIIQMADSNISDFVSHADRTSIGVGRLLLNNTTEAGRTLYSQFDLAHDNTGEPTLIVSKNLWVRTDAVGNTPNSLSIRLRGKIVKPSAKDYMALVLTQTGNLA